jgi:steroid 5-alpha reductase family enzyme
MTELSQLSQAIPPMLIVATLAWLLSLWRHDTGIVDSFWSLFFVTALLVWVQQLDMTGLRTLIVVALVLIWAIRLSVHLTVRNWGKPEDRRYQAIRARNQPHYPIKSLFYVFFLQVGLAFLVALPIRYALNAVQPLGILDGLGVVIFLIGWSIETLADWQLTRFKARGSPQGTVLNTGLWRYSRHPNYFGEAVLWWGFVFLALSAGGPLWLLISPAFITFLLLKVSGVPLLEADLAQRNPNYRRYIESTSAFWPKPPRATP